jgi:hypothetical protein
MSIYLQVFPYQVLGKLIWWGVAAVPVDRIGVCSLLSDKMACILSWQVAIHSPFDEGMFSPPVDYYIQHFPAEEPGQLPEQPPSRSTLLDHPL